MSRTRIRLRKGDEVIVVAGRDVGRRGKIISVDRERGRVVVAGINRVKVHQRPTQKQPHGGIVEREAPIHISNVRFWDPTAEKASRISSKRQEDGRRVRVSRASGETLEG
ncbi:MAG: 50S ribosomal protein L24 [Candidatus Dadabacteria bacterium]|nr:MAG: 50S ribosomal protein L24 [Candidatus Dadabacteria bacterium]